MGESHHYWPSITEGVTWVLWDTDDILKGFTGRYWSLVGICGSLETLLLHYDIMAVPDFRARSPRRNIWDPGLVGVFLPEQKLPTFGTWCGMPWQSVQISRGFCPVTLWGACWELVGVWGGTGVRWWGFHWGGARWGWISGHKPGGSCKSGQDGILRPLPLCHQFVSLGSYFVQHIQMVILSHLKKKQQKRALYYICPSLKQKIFN